MGASNSFCTTNTTGGLFMNKAYFQSVT